MWFQSWQSITINQHQYFTLHCVYVLHEEIKCNIDGTRMYGTQLKLLVQVSGTKNLSGVRGELGLCIAALSQLITRGQLASAG